MVCCEKPFDIGASELHTFEHAFEWVGGSSNIVDVVQSLFKLSLPLLADLRVSAPGLVHFFPVCFPVSETVGSRTWWDLRGRYLCAHLTQRMIRTPGLTLPAYVMLFSFLHVSHPLPFVS